MSDDLSKHRAYVEVAVLMAYADGVDEIQDDELLESKLRYRKPLRALPQHAITDLINHSVFAIEKDGADKRITAIAGALSKLERLEAIDLGLSVCMAKGKVRPKEMDMLSKLQTSFKLSGDQVKALIDKYEGTG